MHIGYFAYQMPLWLCVVIAVVPPMVVALLIRRVRYRGGVDKSAEAKHDAVVAILSTAFVFTVTFSISQVWDQDSKIYEAANRVAQSGLSLTYAVEVADPSQEPLGQDYFKGLMSAMPNDVAEESIAPSPTAKEAIVEFRQWASSLQLDDGARAEVDFLSRELAEAYGEWLVAINAAGIPDVMWLLIFGLGLVLIGFVSYSPPGSTPRFESMMVFLFALVVGTMQIPLWVMNSEGFAYALSQSVLGTFADSNPGLERLVFGILVLFVLGTGFYFALRRITSNAETSDPASTPERSASPTVGD